MTEKQNGAGDEKLSFVGYINKYRTQIMGVAAFLIFLFHQWDTVLPGILPNHPTLARISVFLLKNCFFGVDIFFFISGIGLVWAADKHKLVPFYVRRFKKVYVPFLIAYAVLIPMTDGSFLRYIAVVSGYTFLFENMYTVLWFVPAVMILYIIFPFYNFLLKKLKSSVALTAAAFALWCLGARFLPIRTDLFGFYNRIPIFLIGVMLGRLEKDGKLPKTRSFFLLAAPLLGEGVLTAYYVEKLGKPLLVKVPNCFIPTLCLALGTVLAVSFILSAVHRSKKAGRVFDVILTPVSWLGKTSLHFYLVQMFTVAGIKFADRGIIKITTGSAVWNNVLYFAVIAGLAYILHTVSELLNSKVLRLPGVKK